VSHLFAFAVVLPGRLIGIAVADQVGRVGGLDGAIGRVVVFGQNDDASCRSVVPDRTQGSYVILVVHLLVL
jgi:hypothetical protein